MRIVAHKLSPKLGSVFVGRGPVEQCSICAAHGNNPKEMIRITDEHPDDDGVETRCTWFVHLACLRELGKLAKKLMVL